MVLIANNLPITAMLQLLIDESFRDMSLTNVSGPQVLNYTQ